MLTRCNLRHTDEISAQYYKMADTGESALELALAKASILQLTKCVDIVKRRSERAVQQRAKVPLRAVWVLMAAGSEARVTQKQIAQQLALNQNAMVQLLDKLEKSGHVQRIRNPHNRREQFVRLTAKGRSILRFLFAEQSRLYRTIFAPLDEAKVAGVIDAARSVLAFEAASNSKR